MRQVLSAADLELHSGEPFWPNRNKKRAKFPQLREDVTCDVVVIGGGITGALVSHKLVSAGFDTVVVDKHRVAGGSTSASTALISYEYDELLSSLAKKMGTRNAIRSYELCFEGVQSLKTIIDAIEEPCDYDNRFCVRISNNLRDRGEFDAEIEIRNKYNLPVEGIDESGLLKRFGLVAPLGLVCTNAAQIDPFRLTAALISHGVENGTRVFEKTRVTTYEAGKRDVTLRIPGGAKITAKHVVFCTGYESEKYLNRKLARITTDFCFATGKRRSAGKFEKCHVVEHADNYFYASTFEDWVFVGFEEDRLFRPAERERDLIRKTDELIERAQPHFANIKLAAAQRWAGLFAKSKDSLPYLGTSDELPRSFFVLGYGGNGIASSAMLAPMVVDMIKGKTTSDGKMFGFDR